MEINRIKRQHSQDELHATKQMVDTGFPSKRLFRSARHKNTFMNIQETQVRINN